MYVDSGYCKICNKYICSINQYIDPTNKYRTYRNFFCNLCENNGWRRCVICWKMTISDDAPEFKIKCFYCIKKNNFISYMAF
jgi:hypothetical protein